MNRPRFLSRHPFRVTALVLYLSGCAVAAQLFIGMKANPILFLGGMIWMSWLARACLPSLTRAACVTIWLITLLWSSLLLVVTVMIARNGLAGITGSYALHLLASIAAASAGLLKDDGS